MKKVWCLLVCFLAQTNCLSTFNHDLDKLYRLCPGDEFEYDGFQINSFRTVHGTLSLSPAGKYALEDAVNYHDLFDKTDADQLDEIRSTYHRYLAEMYGQSYLNDPDYSFENQMYQHFTGLQANLTDFRGKARNTVVADRIISLQSLRIEAAGNLSRLLNAHKADLLVPEIIHPGHFHFYLSLLNGDYDKNSTMAFRHENPADVYKKRIYKFERFVPKRVSRIIYDWRKDSGELLSNIYVPFEQRNSKFVNLTWPCVRAKELPPFFQLKGQDGR